MLGRPLALASQIRRPGLTCNTTSTFQSVSLRRWQTTRVRFAPSPTGDLHLGGLRTALFNYLFARHAGESGRFILRIEDTDQKRTVPGATERLIDILHWAGITPDEGPGIPNCPHGPYIQSQRTDIYRQYADLLLQQGAAYQCFCSPERLVQYREGQVKAGKPPVYDKRCSHLSRRTVEENLRQGIPFTVRLRFPGDLKVVPDGVYGNVKVNPHVSDDAILLKSDGYPTYHLANVVDDHLMGITHVLRGEEWLDSTAKHMALYRALGWTMPQFVHLPLLLNSDGTKLSKRTGDVHVEKLRAKGYLPEALVNYTVQLGWWSGTTQDVFTMSELIDQFSLEGINTSNPTVAYEKLDWLNKQHFRMQWQSPSGIQKARLLQTFRDQTTAILPHCNVSDAFLTGAVDLFQDRIVKMTDFPEVAMVCFTDPDFSVERLDSATLEVAQHPDTFVVARTTLEMISAGASSEKSEPARDATFWKVLPKQLVKQTQLKKKTVLRSLRCALTGVMTGPSIVDLMALLGTEECVRRLGIFLSTASPSSPA
ncbi:Glutamate--tRNA ligase mitochondrial [Dispira parvispora]|uniref:Glutamate--tRNA ligase, mitochondrial n=1 Tax=Dispira parvispora TaxID=1520584 RepID=A0A9W8AQD1_9FUNG|nr:Glutamate--tRNA ligase mitochondrial [Dispira parvispora]